MNLFSIVFPLLVIILVVITRKIITSLFSGVILGGNLVKRQFLKGLVAGAEYVIIGFVKLSEKHERGTGCVGFHLGSHTLHIYRSSFPYLQHTAF